MNVLHTLMRANREAASDEIKAAYRFMSEQSVTHHSIRLAKNSGERLGHFLLKLSSHAKIT